MDELTSLKRDLADGYARFARGCTHGEGLVVPGGGLGIAGEDFPDLNWGDTFGPEAAGAFRHFVARLRERRLPGVVSALAADRATLAPVAAELGLGEPVAVVPFMTCTRGEARPDDAGVACRRLGPGDEAALGAVLAEAFDCPPGIMAAAMGPEFLRSPDLVYFMARVDGRDAAAAAAVRVGDTCGVYGVGTLPPLRRRGAGGAATWAAMLHFLERGAGAFALQASELGAPVYERLGFRAVAEVALWPVPRA